MSVDERVLVKPRWDPEPGRWRGRTRDRGELVLGRLAPELADTTYIRGKARAAAKIVGQAGHDLVGAQAHCEESRGCEVARAPRRRSVREQKHQPGGNRRRCWTLQKAVTAPISITPPPRG